MRVGEQVEIIISGEQGVVQRVLYEVLYLDATGCARVGIFQIEALDRMDETETNVVALRAVGDRRMA